MDDIRNKISLLLLKEDLDIINELSAANVLSEWLSCQQLDFQIRHDILKLIAKACSFHTDRQTHNEFIKRLVALKASFIAFMSVFLSTIQSQKTDGEVMLPLRLIFDVVLSIFQCVPVSSTNFIDIILPQLQLILMKLPREAKNELSTEIAELLQQREEMFSKESSTQDETKKEGKEPPPPCNFRDIDLLPNKVEIESRVRPYLRPNVVDGAYENVDHYLDVQFRLMREDMFRYLRESVAEYKSKNWPRDSSALLENGHIYFDVQILSRKYRNGIFFVADVHIGKRVDWSTTKRLMSNSLLCMSSDGFQTFTFVYIRSSSASPNNALSCLLEFSAAEENGEEYLQFGKLYDIIETTSFYEGYRYVLKRLQLFNDENFPLSSPILFLKNCDSKPKYWNRFSFLPGVESEKNAFQEMMSSRNTSFDEHQHQAFQMALSNQVSMIQGPPGTGKTYLGLRIVKWLVQHASLHMGTPILVICYTNHALDQFLEGILKFTEKVVRIGGQSKNLALKHYHINNIANALLKKRSEDELLSDDEEDESRSIGLNILGSNSLLERVGIYTYQVKQTEKQLQMLEDSVHQLDSNPLYGETILLKILPHSLRQEILGWMNSYKRIRALTKFLISGMKKWLCISVSLVHAYEDLPELLSEISLELLSYIDGNGYLNENMATNKLSGKTHADIMSPENKFALSLWKSFLRTGNLAPIAAFKISPRDADNCVQYFLRAHCLNKTTVFKILEKATSKCLEQTDCDSELEPREMWSNGLLERWRAFLEWKSDTRQQMERELNSLKNYYIASLEERDAVRFRNNVEIAKHADILGLTTTGASKHWKLLEQIGPRVVVAEEAAEVLEAHITTALTMSTEHLVLIGDHKQLRPIPSVYELARRFKLDVSMFERLVANRAPSRCLQTQHRMRPCIAELLVPEIYDNLENHPSVQEYEDIKGVASNMYFIKHNVHEDGSSDLRSHRNKHEADFLVSLCRYLLQQGYREDNITILTTYVGQLKLLSEMMHWKLRRNVRVTTVDNFQGEENDIILLSFVRSNERNSLGFLEISNRICVSLSRARKGLFCIGNFDSFAEKCDTWRKIIQKLKRMRLISSSLALKCQNHPTKITLVSRASDFDKVSEGGCSKKCIYHLACGHVCPRKCHVATKGHDEIFCSKKCELECHSTNSNTAQLSENICDKSAVVEYPQVSDGNPWFSYEGDYESDDYEWESCAHIKANNNLCVSGVASRQQQKEYCTEDSPIQLQGSGQDSMEFSDTNRKSEESSVLNSCIAINNDNECVVLENCTQQPNVPETADVSVPLENDEDLSILERKDQITAEELDTVKLDIVQCENDSFAMRSATSQMLHSVLSKSNISIVPDEKIEDHTCKDDKAECTLGNVTVYDVKSEDPECDGDLSLCESVIQICMSEMLSDTRFGEYSDNSKLKDDDLHLQEQMFRKDKLLEILKSEYEGKIFGSGEHCVSHYTADGEPEEISKICDLHKNKKFQCDVLISKKLQCQHEVSVPCNKYNSQYDCKVLVDVQLPCLHVFSVTCQNWMWLKHIRCTVNVSLLMPCGKRLHFICSEGPYHADCVATTLKCGHRVPCYTDVNEYKCDVPIKCSLPCLHEISVPCIVYHYSKKLATLCEVQSETGSEQNILQKLCYERCNFLMECGHRCLGKCGSCTYDRKHSPCSQMVKRSLPCGHQLECECNTKDMFCLERCNVLMKCGHRCSGKCGSCTAENRHPNCSELVMRLLPCGHTVECECHLEDPSCSERCNFLMNCNHRCSGKCSTCTQTQKHPACCELVKVDLPCGHQHETECHVKNPVCNVKCGTVLSCGHPCPGQCGECFNLQIHAMCSELVNRQHPCGHCVEWSCGAPLTVCDKRCLFGCRHSRCINSCLYPCMKCFKPCDWRCEHFTCAMRCGELCNRPPCDVRCSKILVCGHQCCGYCGEPCPNVCILCDTVSTSDAHGGSNWYVLLENCQHSILMEDLNAYFTQKSKNSCPLCPVCGTVISRNRRFGNCIKSWLSSNLNRRPENYTDISSVTDYHMLDLVISEMFEQNISPEFIMRPVKMCHNMNILQRITISSNSLNSDNLKREVRSLKEWLSKHSVICSEQQVEESSRAVRRLCALWYLQNTVAREPELKNCNHCYTDLLALLECKPFGESEEKQIIEVLQQNALKDEGKKSLTDKLLLLLLNSFRSSLEFSAPLEELFLQRFLF